MVYQLLLILGIFFSHEFYVSTTEIVYKEETGNLQITMKIFADDLENAIQEQGTEKLYLGQDKESPQADDYIQKLVLQSFDVETDGNPIELVAIGKEVEQDVVWYYLEAENIPVFKEIKVRNNLLIDWKASQTNIVHVKCGTETKSFLFNQGNNHGVLEF